MKITVFQSDKGDCMLLTSSDSKNILVDGGMRKSYKDHARKKIQKLDNIDLLCVSHIDQDHISGILQLMDDLVTYRIDKYKYGKRNKQLPVSKKRPEVSEIWHNAFDVQAGNNVGAIDKQIAFSSMLNESILGQESDEGENLMTSKREAIQLSYRINAGQLNIPLNSHFNKALVSLENATGVVSIGTATITIIGPTNSSLRKLRSEWNEWLKNNQKTLDKLKRAAIRDAESQDESLSSLDYIDIAARTLGKKNMVTAPNLASIMFVVEENNKTLLMTGDGHWKDITDGLEKAGLKVPGEPYHCTALKVQHHGSEHNLNLEFCQDVIADHYIFCGNGAHHNPDMDVIKTIIKSRLGRESEKSQHEKTGNNFKFWFNSSDTVPGKETYLKHMAKIKKEVVKRASRSDGQFTYKFMPSNRSYITLTI